MWTPLVLGSDAFEDRDGSAPGVVLVSSDAEGAPFAEAAAMGERDNGATWGVPLYGPMLYVHRGTRELIANRSARGFTAEGDVFTGAEKAGEGVVGRERRRGVGDDGRPARGHGGRVAVRPPSGPGLSRRFPG